ncbi:MAG: heparan-alpha-glucosaminide N-acetyltransferase domain-containing protein, partial [Leadbetterella sp.]|nr:heparan-alpha-glucosaminide N-acetyltransferase domain-containing protein [Leadbetterella sp.]
MNRIASIDVFRAITMCLMIFVNDLWTLKGVPRWLLHTEMHEDGMGFSDVIFPVFLVIVGMSLPFAISNRKERGENTLALLKHIGERTLALVVMGFFLVNYEYLKAESLPFAKSWVGIYLVTCFFLIWNSYPQGFKAAGLLKAAGTAGLVLAAFTFPGGIGALKPYWWGILGLIGWSY